MFVCFFFSFFLSVLIRSFFFLYLFFFFVACHFLFILFFSSFLSSLRTTFFLSFFLYFFLYSVADLQGGGGFRGFTPPHPPPPPPWAAKLKIKNLMCIEKRLSLCPDPLTGVQNSPKKICLAATRLVDDAPHRKLGQTPPPWKKLDPPLLFIACHFLSLFSFSLFLSSFLSSVAFHFLSFSYWYYNSYLFTLCIPNY